MLEAQLAVQLNPGSKVIHPVFPKRVRISRSLLPKVPDSTGISIYFPLKDILAYSLVLGSLGVTSSKFSEALRIIFIKFYK